MAALPRMHLNTHTLSNSPSALDHFPAYIYHAVVLACRNQSKGDAMVKQLTAEAQQAGRPTPSLEVNLLDLSSLDSVRAFVQRWQQRPLHVLVNNAGLFNMGGAC